MFVTLLMCLDYCTGERNQSTNAFIAFKGAGQYAKKGKRSVSRVHAILNCMDKPLIFNGEGKGLGLGNQQK